MSTPNKYTPQTNVQSPCCPHCGARMPEVNTYQWNKQLGTGLSIALVLYCPNAECSKVIHSQIFIVQGAQEDSGIVRPS